MAATAVIIGSSARTDPAKGIIGRSAYCGDDTKAGNLSGVLADCGNVHGWLTGRKGVHVGATAFLASPDPTVVSKARVVEEIQKAVASHYSAIVIYYSGHGEPLEGSWCFDNGETLSPKEVLDLIPLTKPCVIISDSCFSGKWVTYARDHARSTRRKQLYVQSSSSYDKVSYDSPEGGVFTQSWLKSNHNDFTWGQAVKAAALSNVTFVVKGVANIFREISNPMTYPSPFEEGDCSGVKLRNGEKISLHYSWTVMCTHWE